MKNKQISLDIDPTVKPIAEPFRRIPFNLRGTIRDKKTELLDMGIIEPVEGPAPWVNPVLIVPKNNGEIRLCVDMKQANQAIMRRHWAFVWILYYSWDHYKSQSLAIHRQVSLAINTKPVCLNNPQSCSTLSYDLILAFVNEQIFRDTRTAREQAFGRAGNWGREKRKGL